MFYVWRTYASKNLSSKIQICQNSDHGYFSIYIQQVNLFAVRTGFYWQSFENKNKFQKHIGVHVNHIYVKTRFGRYTHTESSNGPLWMNRETADLQPRRFSELFTIFWKGDAPHFIINVHDEGHTVKDKYV